MNIEIISVTPELASKWLKTNSSNNRKIRKSLINQYARDMAMGKWELTGEAIKFDIKGNLIDGQHRLNAIVFCKTTVQIAVVTGLQPEVIQVIDTGKSRSAGDVLTITGKIPNANMVAALARKIIGFNGGTSDIFGNKKIRLKGEAITNRDILEFCEQFDLQVHVLFAVNLMPKQVTNIFSCGEWGFLHWLFSNKSPEAADTFLTRLATLDNVGLNHPIRTLFEKITKGSSMLSPKLRLAATIIAWNAYRNGQSLSVIKVGRIEEVFPQAV